MPDWNAARAAEIVRGRLLGDGEVPVRGCVLDSRKASEGELFFALPGEKVDGHIFISAAWENGAGVAVGNRQYYEEHPLSQIPQGKALILVDSVPGALQALAQAWRQELACKVVGITGSNGKTTTKDMVAAVLATSYRVHKNTDNHNNELGLPLTILNAPPDTEVMVLEMGMRGLGEIGALCQIARPDLGVITNIGTAHLELLGTRERIAQAKWELAQALPPQGFIILNAEDEWSVRKAGEAEDLNIRFYGLSGRFAVPDISGRDLKPLGSLGTSFEVSWQDEKVRAELPLPGEHNVLDALAALACGTVLGIPLAQACRALSQFQLSKMRLEVLAGINDSTIISDVYNANPDSMRASVRILKERAKGKKTLAILGEMYELGEASAPGHRSVGHTVAELGIDELICVGELAWEIGEGARLGGMDEAHIHRCLTRAEGVLKAKDCLEQMGAGTWVLIKGSRGMKMEEITDRLKV